MDCQEFSVRFLKEISDHEDDGVITPIKNALTIKKNLCNLFLESM